MILEANGLRRLVDAHVAYDAAASEAYDEVLFDVVARVEDAKSLGKVDIGALLFWKRLRADTPWVMALNRTPDTVVRQATGAMYVAANNEVTDTVSAAGEARSALSVLPGFSSGDALASALILAAAPERMAVFDRRAVAALKGLGVKTTTSRGQYRRYMQIVEDIRMQLAAQDITWLARDVDKALFMLGG
ncbi:hypothetical protein J2W54_004832 [Rhodococcus fascians]|uniref:hypothetical protein n=1 Tax=Nocardiaceae TaxID=85025 RepID=UPI0024B8BBE2|nr:MULTISPECIES: hypothetical protein [Rhodococcus]MDJ0427277.1 hypothetical protein [Rhodococcus fascians]MDR6912901.1 hypothetical protein [Rhodococcus sp. 3258]MDR6934417.1 hypothetical protein [Rhodococcus fascians]